MKKYLTLIFLLILMFNGLSQKQNLAGDTKNNEIIPENSKAYCSSTYTNQTDDWITNVTFNTINNTSGQEGAISYGDYDTVSTGLLAGNTYSLSISFFSSGYTQHVWAWFDWNGDDDFLDAGEAYDLGYGIDATLTTSILVPMTATVGHTMMRIIEQYSTDPTPCDPHGTVYGETEDYSLYISSNSYCSASGNCDEYIQMVQIPGVYTIMSGCDGYLDLSYFNLCNIPVNSSETIDIYIANPYSSDQCGVWVDWNNDNDFYDANETISVTGIPDLGVYAATIVPPAGTTLGNYHMRIRIMYTGTLDPCGTTTYGEVEDYSFTVTPEIPATWTGAVDNNWHNADNWNINTIPDATTDVTIPDVTNKCWVYAGPAFCNNITVEYGSGYDLRIYDKYLNVSGNMNCYGELLMDHTDGHLIINGNMIWESGSMATIMAYSVIEVKGDWIFKSGANVTMDDGLVGISGTGSSYIRTFEENCYFNDLVIYKSSPDWASIGSTNTANMYIHGDFGVEPGSILYMYTPESVFLQGDLINLGSFLGYDGTLVMNGDDQMIYGSSPGSTQLFNELTISSNVSTNIYGNEITVANDLLIESGQLISNDFTISVGGDWNNQVGPAGFNEGTGRVIFTGLSTYINGNENFYILELNKTSFSSLLRVEGYTVTCQHYDWTNGTVKVRSNGVFTANDLVDNGIFGGWETDITNGTINLSNYGSGQYVDLNGYLDITGGTINVYGGDGPSYWPYAADAEIYLLNGILDFHDVGIYIYDSPTYTLTDNIVGTGGLIRTAGGFWGESNEFTADYGTMEFYGSNDAYIYTINGCYLNDVIINKSTKGKSVTHPKIKKKTIPLFDERSGKTIGNGAKSNTLTMNEFLDINGSLTISDGFLNSNGYNIQIEGDWTNFMGDPGFIESTGWVTFDGAYGAHIHTNEVFANLMLNKNYTGIDGLELSNGIIVDVRDDLSLDDGTMEMNANSVLRVDSNLFIANEAGLNADDLDNTIYVGGDWTNENTSNTSTQGFYASGESVIFNGGVSSVLTTNANEEHFTNLTIDKPGTYFFPADSIKVSSSLSVLNGNWTDLGTNLNHKFGGDILIESAGVYRSFGTTTIMGNNDQYYQNNGGIAIFKNLMIDKSGSFYIISNSFETVDETTTINNGILNLNGNAFHSDDIIEINNGGELIVNAGAQLALNDYMRVMTGGTLTIMGEPGNYAYVHYPYASPSGYQIEIFGGTVHADYAYFHDLGTPGIWIHSGSYVDPINSFNNCIFEGSGSTGGSTYLAIDNDQVITIDNASFPLHTGATNITNISKNFDQGEVNLTNASGEFAGPLYENDLYDRIHWPGFVPGLWTGSVSSDWFDPDNWSDFVVPGSTTDVVIPSGTPNDPVINNSSANAFTVEIQSGASLEIGNDTLNILSVNFFDSFFISGELIMTISQSRLFTPYITWEPGSTDDITAGEIYTYGWIWEDGTYANLGTGNTAYVSSLLTADDPDAAFGNLVFTMDPFSKSKSKNKSLHPVRVNGNFDVLPLSPGLLWGLFDDWIIYGNWTIASGAWLNITGGAHLECYGALNLQGKLEIDANAEVWVHDNFIFPVTGELVINEGLFMCDHHLPSGWIDLFGNVQMTLGSLEFPDANISFINPQSISGGTILAGRSVSATGAGAFVPTGGILELIGSGTGHYLQLTNGNQPYELHVSRLSPIGIHPGSPLIIQSYLILNSELKVQSNPITVYGDVAISAGGILDLDEYATLEMANNRWININFDGTLKAIGFPGSEAIIRSISGYYYLSVENGGTISAESTIFEYLGSEGVTVQSGAYVDPIHAFHGCVFQNGVSGGQLLSIYNTQSFTVDDAIFPTNTWGGSYNVYKNSTPGDVTFSNATGDFAGEPFDYDPYNHVHWTVPGIRLSLTVFLEGPFNGTDMNPDINPILPLAHPFQPVLPYFGNPLPDWYYTGADAVAAIPDPNIVDWILVELRDAPDILSAIPSTAIARKATFLLNDGTVVDLDGFSELEFTNSVNDQLFVAIWQRNHIGIISANPLVQTAGIYSYDYSSGSGQVHGGASAHKHLGGGTWGMFSGDGDGDGFVDFPDKVNVWMIQAGLPGYLESDYNLNMQSDNTDKNDYWLPNLGSGSAIP